MKEETDINNLHAELMGTVDDRGNMIKYTNDIYFIYNKHNLILKKSCNFFQTSFATFKYSTYKIYQNENPNINR